MSRSMRVAAAQLGPIARDESREQVVKRLLELMHEAADWGVDVIVYPELALTTFFPRWAIEDDAEIDSWFEAEMPNVATQPLFDEAKRLGIGFHLGYGEIAWPDNVKHRFNTAIIVDKSGEIVGKFRKIHIPGHHEGLDRPGQHLEKKYFEVGDLGFPVYQAFGASCGMAICNDRRWPETWRVMGLQGVEIAGAAGLAKAAHGAGEVLELIVTGNKIGFAVDFDHGAISAVRRDRDQTFSRHASGLFGGFSKKITSSNISFFFGHCGIYF